MPIEIKNVLVCDAVDPSCVELLESNGISVDYKLKLPENVLIDEAKVKYVTGLDIWIRVKTRGIPRVGLVANSLRRINQAFEFIVSSS